MPNQWVYLFAAAVAWVASDALISLFIRGGERAVQIRFLGHLIQPVAYCFLVFLIGVFIASWISGLLPGLFLYFVPIGVRELAKIPSQEGIWIITVLLGSLLMILLVFADLQVRFYKREN